MNVQRHSLSIPAAVCPPVRMSVPVGYMKRKFPAPLQRPAFAEEGKELAVQRTWQLAAKTQQGSTLAIFHGGVKKYIFRWFIISVLSYDGAVDTPQLHPLAADQVDRVWHLLAGLPSRWGYGRWLTHLRYIIPGNKARIGRHDYDAPGLRMSGALTLAVEEANRGSLCCGHR